MTEDSTTPPPDTPALAAYVRDRFTPSFRAAFDAWVADGRREHSPFAHDS
jgi:hypothetical protein